MLRCLAKDPDDRPQTPRELVHEFREALCVASSRPARALGVDRVIGRAGDYLHGPSPHPARPPAGGNGAFDRVAASQAQADPEIIGDEFPCRRSRTKTSVNRGRRAVMIMAAGSLLPIHGRSGGPDSGSASRVDASRPASEETFDLGGVAMECVHLPSRGIYMGKFEVTNRQFRDTATIEVCPPPGRVPMAPTFRLSI